MYRMTSESKNIACSLNWEYWKLQGTTYKPVADQDFVEFIQQFISKGNNE